ncbi:MAG TPA: hypothetical protein VHF58_05885 [Solirubrobacterales bacterium]|nr:hypothetical protein [Solirubrobacterales bacterium]
MLRLAAVLALVVILAAVVLVVVTGDDGDEAGREIPGDAEAESAAVIDEWAMTLAAGDVDGAAELFALPSVAENGGLVFQIETIEDAREFNRSLPCGAELTRAVAEGDATIATFVLKERPGPGSCGDGTGQSAQTAFVIEDGEIVEWRRVDDVIPEAQGTPA